MKPHDSDVVRLVDGGRLVLRDGQLTILRATSGTVQRIDLSDITGVRRGGRDLVITRRETDPVVVTTVTLADAQWFVALLHQHQSASQSKPWWRRRRG